MSVVLFDRVVEVLKQRDRAGRDQPADERAEQGVEQHTRRVWRFRHGGQNVDPDLVLKRGRVEVEVLLLHEQIRQRLLQLTEAGAQSGGVLLIAGGFQLGDLPASLLDLRFGVVDQSLQPGLRGRRAGELLF